MLRLSPQTWYLFVKWLQYKNNETFVGRDSMLEQKLHLIAKILSSFDFVY